jgi:hypothetical protein
VGFNHATIQSILGSAVSEILQVCPMILLESGDMLTPPHERHLEFWEEKEVTTKF